MFENVKVAGVISLDIWTISGPELDGDLKNKLVLNVKYKRNVNKQI